MVGTRHPKGNPSSTSPGQAHLPVPPGQAHLPVPSTSQQTALDENARIDKLVSLTYDSDPIIRKQAALELAKIDDPRAIFALLEMMSDKAPDVQATARASLDQFADKEDQEAIVNLEKIFEARQEGKSPAEDVQAVRSKMMPSIEKLFSRHKDARSKMMPSIEKLFSWMSHKAAPASPEAAAPSAASPPPASASHSSSDELEQIESPKPASTLDEAEADVGVPPARMNPDQMRKARPTLESESSSSMASYLPPSISSSARRMAPTDTQLEEAGNFPLPESLQQKMSATASIPNLMPDEKTEAEMVAEEKERLPRSRLDYYKWAYALAVTPGMKASDMKKEKDRLVKDAKHDIELAFQLAADRAKENGIENLGGLKPGMKKITTFPLQVVEVSASQVPQGRNKMAPMSRLALSDGKRVVPLYCPPERADGIKVGDLVSVRDMQVDYFVHSQELVMMLGKNGQLVVTK